MNEEDPRAQADYLRDALAVVRRLRRAGEGEQPPDLARIPSLAHARHFHPAYFRLPFSHMHVESLMRYDAQAAPGLAGREGRRVAIVAPRGSAKSTLHAMLFPLLDILHGRERHIVILSATLGQASLRVRNLKAELSRNAPLAARFPAVRAKAALWTRRAFSVNGVTVEAFGAGAELRGIGSGEYRPTKIILDDAEASARALSPRGRKQTADWFAEVVENLGDRYTHIEVVGTILHPDSLLSRLLRRPDFEARAYRSVEAWSARPDLWEEWRTLFNDATNPRRVSSARTYFLARREEMLRGTRVLWPAREPYDRLMAQVETMGRPAFFKEKQNQPLAASGRTFAPERFIRFTLLSGRLELEAPATRPSRVAPHSATTGDAVQGELPLEFDEQAPPPTKTRTVSLSDLVIFGFLDSALGRDSLRGDFAAIATVGRAPDGTLHTLDLWMDRVSPARQAEVVFDLHAGWNYAAFGFEANAYQLVLGDYIERERLSRRAAGLPCAFTTHAVAHHTAKIDRIGTLEPGVHRGWLTFNRALPDEFWIEADQFPHSEHDDGLDALAAAVLLAQPQAAGGPILRVGRRGSAGVPA